MISNRLNNIKLHLLENHKLGVSLSPENSRLIAESLASLALQVRALENALVPEPIRNGSAELGDNVVVFEPKPIPAPIPDPGGDAA